MPLQIVPTTTFDELIVNNTSSSSAFPGWPNGVARAANVSHTPLNIQQKALVHRCDWWGYGNHPDIGVKSNDPVYCAKTVADMKARGFDGCYLDWYGPNSNEDKSLLAMKPELERQGVMFSLCVDGGMKTIKAATTDAGRTTALLNAIAYARTVYFASSQYYKINGKPVILFFGFATSDYDWTKIRAALADCLLIFRWEYQPTQYSDRSYADGYFGWTECSEAWILNVKTRAPGKLIILGINAYFNNTVAGDPVKCTWGVGQNKTIASRGGLHLQDHLAVARAHPEIIATSFNTWNDYQEGSALEPGLASGAGPLMLAEENGVLSWVDPGASFDRVDVYVSLDGGRSLMPLAVSRGVVSVDLKAMDFDDALGPYTFVLRAVGKPMVQNLVSNVISASLGWSKGVSA